MNPVGIFDSGVGGLSVLAEFTKLAPGHPVVYLADQAWAPYGERSLDEVRSRSVAIAEFLIDRGCDPVVVACNSASAAALHHLRDVFPEVRFVGMEPAVKPAANHSERGVIGVLATDATFQGELYASVVDRHANGVEVVEQACPGLADAVERLGVDAAETVRLVDEYVTPMRAAGVDTLVLGCTHYPFLLGAIERAAGPEITVIDPAPAVARQTLRVLGASGSGGEIEFLTTGEVPRFAEQIFDLLGVTAAPKRVQIDRRTDIRAAAGDLTVLAVDVIVNAANVHLQHGGGVAGAILRAGGSVIQQESDAWLARNGPLQEGQAAITTAGAMPAEHVVHVAGPIYRNGQDNERMLRSAVSAALDAAASIGARSIAFPAISAGIYGYPVGEATATLASEVVDWVRDHPDAMGEVVLVGFDGATAGMFEAALAAD